MHGSWHLFQRFCCMRVPAATRTNQCCLGRRHFKEMALQPRSCWNLSTANLQGSLFLISGVDQQAQFLIWHFCAGMALGTWDRMSLSVTLLETKTATSRCRKTSKGLPLIHGLRTPMQRQRSGSGEMKSWESQDWRFSGEKTTYIYTILYYIYTYILYYIYVCFITWYQQRFEIITICRTQMQHSGFGDMRSQMKGLSLIHGLRTPMQRQRSGSGEMKSWESQVRTRTCIRLMRIDVSFLKLQLSYIMLSNLLYPTYILPLCSDRRTPMMRRASGEMRSYKS